MSKRKMRFNRGIYPGLVSAYAYNVLKHRIITSNVSAGSILQYVLMSILPLTDL